MKLIDEMHEALESAWERMTPLIGKIQDQEFKDAYHEVCEVLDRYENTPVHLRRE